MERVNRTIIASVIIIMAAGILHMFLTQKITVTGPGGIIKSATLTKVLIGGYMLGLIASLFDLVGFGVGQVAGWILLLAVGTAIFTVAQDIYTLHVQSLGGFTGGGSSHKLM